MSSFIDLAGMRFGKLTVVKRVENKANRVMWECKCDCGNVKNIRTDQLRGNVAKSCGCLQAEVTARMKTTHGKSKIRLYSIWHGMKERCYNVNHDRYKDYGGKGTTIFDEWKNNFQSFYDWAMANGYKDSLTIDRIDTNGNYEPANCRWITNKEQQNNRTDNHYVTFNGETKTLKEWSEFLGVNYSTLNHRINQYGWSIEKALTEKVRVRK